MSLHLNERFGSDEWVAREARRLRDAETSSPWHRLHLAWERIDARQRLLLLLVLCALLPLATHDLYLLRVAGLTGLYVILAMGLNVVAGLAGLLDLGYVAFYGVGAYLCAFLASPHFDQHWPFVVILPLATLVTALLGLLLGLPSLRLRGDYLAIVTLGFGQIASVLFLNLDRVNLPFLGLDRPLNITGGPNGIIRIDDIKLLGLTIKTPTDYYYLILLFVGLVFVALYHLDRSRIGRAWRAIREDELAAQAMGVDIRRLKLLAFVVGAAIAGMTGVLFATWQGAVFPPNFEVSMLIILYSMVVLGGVGSLWGALTGAVALSIFPELLRSPELARVIFYLLLCLALLARKTRKRGLAALGGIILLGVALKLILPRLYPTWFVVPSLKPSVARSLYGPLMRMLNAWMLFPKEARMVGNVTFVITLGLLLAVVRFKGRARPIVLVPALYGLAFIWETRLAQEPSTTRMLILGALLVLAMNYRPQGLFGQQWVQRL